MKAVVVLFSKWRTTPVVEEVSVEVSALVVGVAVVVVAEAGGEGAGLGVAKPRTRRYKFVQYHRFSSRLKSKTNKVRLV